MDPMGNSKVAVINFRYRLDILGYEATLIRKWKWYILVEHRRIVSVIVTGHAVWSCEKQTLGIWIQHATANKTYAMRWLVGERVIDP